MKKLLILAAMVATSAHAEFWSGNQLLTRLQGDTIAERIQALGYIMGVADATQGSGHCPPEQVTSGQIRDMVRNHLESVPSARHIEASSHVVYVLGTAWPCAKKGRNL